MVGLSKYNLTWVWGDWLCSFIELKKKALLYTFLIVRYCVFWRGPVMPWQGHNNSWNGGKPFILAFHPVRTGTWHPPRGNPSYFSLVIRQKWRHFSPLLLSQVIGDFYWPSFLPCHSCVCKKIPVRSLKWQQQLRDHPVKNLPVWLRCADTARGIVCK